MNDGVEGGKVWGYEKPPKAKRHDSPVVHLVSNIVMYGAIMVGLFLFGRTSPSNLLTDHTEVVIVVCFLFTFVSPVFLFLPQIISLLISKIFTKTFKLNKSNIKRKSWTGGNFFALFATMLTVFMIGVTFGTGEPSDEEIFPEDKAYLEEYGYVDVGYVTGGETVDVTDKEGNEKTVYVMSYEGQVILYENSEQLREKMSEVDAGTYAKGLENEE